MKNRLSLVSSSLLTVALCAAPMLASAQTQSASTFGSSSSALSTQTFVAPESGTGGAGDLSGFGAASTPPADRSAIRPFSRIALGVGVSPLGIGFLAATNINRHFNLRATGNFFQYTDDGITTEGFNVTAKINMASAGASVDYYPFHKGFRLSPGVLFYNQNKADVTFVAAPGTSFTLDNHTYYSGAGSEAVIGHGKFGLGDGRAAFTATTGWGNVIPASGRHFSFPFEVGVAFIKQPTVALNLTGFVCDSNGQNCVDVESDPTAQADLAVQVKSYANDINQLKTYPIVSFGVAYNFRIR